MIRWLLVFFWAVCVGFALFVGRTSRGHSHGITVIELYVLRSITVINIGFLVCFHEFSQEAWAGRALISTSLGLGLVALGGLTGMACLGAGGSWAQARPIEVNSDIPYTIAVTSGLVVFFIVLLYFYLLGYVPIVKALRHLRTGGYVQGLMNTLRVGRDPYVNPDARHIPLQGFMELIRYQGLPIIAVWFLWFYLRGIKPAFSMAMLVTSVLLTVMAGQRWPLRDLLVILVIFYSWTESDSRRYWGFVWRAGKMAVLAGVILTILLGRGAEEWLGFAEMVARGAGDLLERLVVGNADVPFLSYRVFPDTRPWLLGSSWVQNLAAYLPGPGASFPVTFSQIVTGTSAGFTAPPDFYTEAYVNFGFAGVSVVSFAWGFFVGVFHRLCCRKRQGLLTTSILALGFWELASSAVAGINALVGFAIVAAFMNVIVRAQKVFLSPYICHVPINCEGPSSNGQEQGE